MASSSGEGPAPTTGRKSRGAPVQRAVSSGGIVYRRGQRGVEVVIVGRSSDGVWGLPKGTPNEGETLEETALREVNEETGLDVRVVDKLGLVEYWFAREGVRYHKWVHYFLMECTGGDTSRHDLEYDKVEWRHIQDALRTLTFKNEANMLSKARQMIRELE